jgi:Ser/Thr protein kinase RdoA (MazF antagonist)
VLKLWRDAGHGERASREAAALRTLAAAGVPAPQLFDSVTVDGRPGLVVEHVDGLNLLAVLRRHPLSVFKAGRTLGAAHVAMHDCVAPGELPSLHDLLHSRIAEAPPLPGDLRSAAHALLDDLPVGDRLCHGDLHPGNLLGSWAAPVVIDWGDAARGAPVADVARTALLLRMGEVPPGVLGPFERLAGVGRRILRDRYLSTYLGQRPLDQALLDRWELVRAAARLWEPIPGEHPHLLALLRTGLAQD